MSPHLLTSVGFITVQSKRRRHQQHITYTEGKAYIWSFRRRVCQQRSHSHRHLFLLDNLPTVLGVAKGRPSARNVRTACR